MWQAFILLAMSPDPPFIFDTAPPHLTLGTPYLINACPSETEMSSCLAPVIGSGEGT